MTPRMSQGGILAWFAGNPVAANLLMLFLLVGGLMIAQVIVIEGFPQIDDHRITVSVSYPGASPEQVEESINRRIESVITGIEGIKKLTSTAREGFGNISAEVDEGSDKNIVLDEIQIAVNRIVDFPPEDAKEPQFQFSARRQAAIVVAVYGDVGQKNLYEVASNVRDDLMGFDGISLVQVTGVPGEEIAIQVNEMSLRKYDMSFSEIADAVRQSSVNRSGGVIHTTDGDVLLRANQQAYRQGDFEQIVLRSEADGSQLRLSEVASVKDGARDTRFFPFYNGKPTAYVIVYRTGDEQILEIEQTVKNYVATQALPEGIESAIWFNNAIDVRSRINLLMSNGLLGLVFVFVILLLFLNLKLAFWTTMGIPISFLGAFFLISAGGGTINEISLFAFILVLGIVVDDAIIIGESIFSKREQGLPPMQATIEGLYEVVSPVAIGVFTTILASIPILFTSGDLGQVLSVAPLVIIAVLLMSLIEAYLILPAHLSNIRIQHQNSAIDVLQRYLRHCMQWFIDCIYIPSLRVTMKAPYIVVAVAIASSLMTVGFVKGGHIETVFFPEINGNTIVVPITLPKGSPIERTEAFVQTVIEAAEQAGAEFDEKIKASQHAIISSISSIAGNRIFSRNSVSEASHYGEVTVELIPNEERTISTEEFKARWRELLEIPIDVEVAFFSNELASGNDISVALTHSDNATLLRAVERLKDLLAKFEGVVDIEDNFSKGGKELELTLTAAGHAANVRLEDVASQVRQAFSGEEVQRVQRGRDDIQVYVRYSEQERYDIDSLYNMRVRLDSGEQVPLQTIAFIEEQESAAVIRRSRGKRIIEVDADVKSELANSDEINQFLRNNTLPQLLKEFPGLSFSFEGLQREREKSFKSLLRAMAISVLAIFALLAVQLRSYTQPLIIMSVVPVGFIGAVIGHGVLGFPLSFISFFGVVALSGIVVNDSLILLDMINRLSQQGMILKEAIIEGCRRRFRPIIFTSLTTSIGLTPMLLEKSTQAQYLIPMAVSIAAGVLFATLITLFLVPSLYMIRAQCTELVRKEVWANRMIAKK